MPVKSKAGQQEKDKPKALTIRQWDHYEGDDWWSWAVWVEGPAKALDLVDFVEWVLHPTFPNPVRKIKDRASKFRLETGGWGEFRVIARVRMQDGTQTKLRHDLELHKPKKKSTSK
jgi:transcription initiation factor IIF auxiliary subunit